MNFELLRTYPVDISRYLPKFLGKDEAFQNLLDTFSWEHEKQRLALQDVGRQFFVPTATWGIRDWERIVDVTPNGGDTYEQRRNRVLLKLNGRQTSTLDFMGHLISRYIDGNGGSIEEHNEKNTFSILLDGTIKDKKGLDEALDTYKPAHLGYDYQFQVTDLSDNPLGGLDGLLAQGDDVLACVGIWFKDVVPYGRALDYPKYDGEYRASDMYHVGNVRADGTLQAGAMLPGALRVQEGIDWQFIPDGAAFADGSFRADGSLIANGERPWILQYNDFMDELSILIITMRKPDGTTELEDDVAFYPKVGEGIRACGGARAGKTQIPVDNCGRLEVTRSHKADGSVQAGAEMNVADGSIRADGSFRADGGGIHPRIDILRDDLCGGMSIVHPKKGPSFALRYPELFDDVQTPAESESADMLLAGFEDDAATMDKPFTLADGLRADGSARIGAGNLLPLDTGGTLTIIHVLTANGLYKADGGLSYKADGSCKVGSIQLKGGNQVGTRRHDETL